MGFAQDTAIVQPADVARITFEEVLGTTRFDKGGATIAGLCNEATNALMREIARVRGEDPAQVTNTTDFMFAAAHWVRARVYASLPQGDPENANKAAASDQIFRDEVAKVVIRTSANLDQTNASRGLPTVVNVSSEPAFNRPRDSKRPGSVLQGPWRPDPTKGP